MAAPEPAAAPPPLPPQPLQPPEVIHLWSGPRCCSTSLMYAFAQRADTDVLDEPLYAAYLLRTGHDRPYRQQVMDSMSHDGDQVMREISAPRAKRYVFAKHIAKFKICVGNDVFKTGKHLLLVREPYNVLQSFSKVLSPTQQELGYTALLEVASELRSQGKPVHVVLSDQLVADAEGTLRAACAALDIPYDPAMLSWPPGPKPYDGVWAPWWYENTHQGTGFAPAVQTDSALRPLPDCLKPLLSECQAILRLLRRDALRPFTLPFESPGCGDGAVGAAAAGGSGGALVEGCSDDIEERNRNSLVMIRDSVSGAAQLVWRPEAYVSALDSGYMMGDGVWEGILVHRGVLLFVEAHLSRLYEAAAALDMRIDLRPQQLQQLMYTLVDANDAADASDLHLRLMVTRGLKRAPYQSPSLTVGDPTIVVVPHWKRAPAATLTCGWRLFTVHVRRGPADVQDPMWNSHCKLNCIAACIQAKHAGADEALMLDPHGFVATCNSVNFFVVRRGEVWAPTPKYQLHGITRSNVLALCQRHGIPHREADFSLTQVYAADEAFVTGTVAGLIPVHTVDGRPIGDGTGRGPMTERLQRLYGELKDKYVADGRRDLGGKGPRELL